MSKQILSIDGGGIKGIVSAIFLASLEKRLQYYSKNDNARLADYFHLVAGTSTGSILTALYLYPNERGESKYSASEAVDFYEDYGKYIFKRQFGYPLFGAKYTNRYLAQMLSEMFHEDTLCDVRRPCLITAYDITRREAVFFNSVSCRTDENRNYTIKDAILASCAAPTYFPPVNAKEKRKKYSCLIDGGVVANNPTMCALIEALKLSDCREINEIVAVSVGNIRYEKSYHYSQVNRWGLLCWAQPMLSVLMDGSEQIVDYQVKKLYQSMKAPKNYYRFEARGNDKVPAMDDCSEKAMKTFRAYGQELVQKESLRIDELAKRLVSEQENNRFR